MCGVTPKSCVPPEVAATLAAQGWQAAHSSTRVPKFVGDHPHLVLVPAVGLCSPKRGRVLIADAQVCAHSSRVALTLGVNEHSDRFFAGKKKKIGAVSDRH